MEPTGPVSTESSFAGLLKSIVADVQGIIRAEIRLAKAEMREDLRVVVRSAAAFGAAAVCAWFGLSFTLAAIFIGLARLMPWWGAAVVLAAVLLIAAAVLYFAGRKRIATIRVGPEKTVQSVRENIQWAKDRMK